MQIWSNGNFNYRAKDFYNYRISLDFFHKLKNSPRAHFSHLLTSTTQSWQLTRANDNKLMRQRIRSGSARWSERVCNLCVSVERNCRSSATNHDHLFQQKLGARFRGHFFRTNYRSKIVPRSVQNKWYKRLYFLNSGDAIPIETPMWILMPPQMTNVPSHESPPSQSPISSEDED